MIVYNIVGMIIGVIVFAVAVRWHLGTQNSEIMDYIKGNRYDVDTIAIEFFMGTLMGAGFVLLGIFIWPFYLVAGIVWLAMWSARANNLIKKKEGK